MSVIYPNGQAEITVALGSKLTLQSESAVKIYKLSGYPNLPGAWEFYTTVNAGTLYLSAAVSAATRFKIEATESPVYYNYGNSPLIIEKLTVKDFGAKGDGVTDDSDAIQNCINYALSIGGGSIDFPPGTYLVSKAITGGSNLAFTGHGRSSTIKLKANAGNISLFYPAGNGTGGNYVTVRELFFDGNKANQGAASVQTPLLIVAGSKHVKVENCYFNAWNKCASCIDISSYSTVDNPCEFINISNNHFELAQGACIKCNHQVIDLVIHGNICEGDNVSHAIGIQPFDAADIVSNIVISSNVITGFINGMVIGTALSTAVSSVNIIGNIIHDLTQGYITHAGILCYIASKINISNNSISSITGDPCPGILLTAFAGKTITGVNITGNFISGYGGDSAIGVIALKGNATGNIIDVNIAGNIIEPPLAGGIPNLSASYVNGLMVCGNSFTKGTLNSVYVNNSSNISIIGNYITGIDGIKAELVNDKLSIIGNMIKTTRYGVNLTNNTDLSIIGNSINSPSGNSITTCTFINNILATKTWDPGNVLAAASTTTTITATNSQLGDYVDVSFSQPLQNMILTGFVSVAGTVTVMLFNPTAAPIDLTSGTLNVTVYR